MEEVVFWNECKKTLEKDLSFEEYSTWISPLMLKENQGSKPESYAILAPNRFILDWVEENYGEALSTRISNITRNDNLVLTFEVLGDEIKNMELEADEAGNPHPETTNFMSPLQEPSPQTPPLVNSLIPSLTFKNFVIGKSNHIALAAAKQVAQGSKESYNPLFIYGGVGLGKTHLMHAIGNRIQKNLSGKKISYIHSERFVSDMVK